MIRLLALLLLLWIAPAQAATPAQQLVLFGGSCDITKLVNSSLKGYWDASRTDTITGGAAPTIWRSVVGGYAATVSGTPVWSASSLSGSPGITFNGTADFFTFNLSGQFPVNAVPSEVWVVAINTSLAGTRRATGYGNGNATERSLGMVAQTPTTFTGAGGAPLQAQSGGGWNSVGVLRGSFGATSTLAQFNSAAPGITAVTPTTTGTRFRIGASTAAAAATFFQGVIGKVFITDPLSSGVANQLLRCLQ